MGNSLSYIGETVIPAIRRGKKRKRADYRKDIDEEFEAEIHSPKRKKLKCTSNYIYQALFEEGQNSDMTVVALGKFWRLHKIYLCQSPYFASMFSGSWKESKDSYINIEIVDPTITEEAIRTVLGSFYKSELVVEPADVVPVLATATLFQHEGLIEQCANIMSETLGPTTVMSYYNAAVSYGQQHVQKSCSKWFLYNLMSIDSVEILKEISPALMERVIRDPSLFAIQTEFSVYLRLKSWMFVQCNPSYDCSSSTLGKVAVASDEFFRNLKNSKYFLETDQGKEFWDCFRALRLPQLVCHHRDLTILEEDRIIPLSWLLPVYRTQWKHMLRVEQSYDHGCKKLEESVFDSQCIRVGRILESNGQHLWRWTCYNFAFDLILIFEYGKLKIKRGRPQAYISHLESDDDDDDTKRHIMYRFVLAYLDRQGRKVKSKRTKIESVSLSPGDEVQVMSLEPNFPFPLHLSANFMIVSPPEEKPNT